MTTATGGPAFPCAEWLDTLDPSAVNPMHHQGMTLRDYFAASFITSGVVFKNLSSGSTTDEVAAQAYALADAMLKARQA
jgi:hypothetical protein